MPQAKGALKRVGYVLETAFGATPTTEIGTSAKQLQIIDYVEFKGDKESAVITDPSINTFRQRTFSRTGNYSTTAELNVKLAPDNLDDFLEAALMGTWSTGVLKVGTLATAVRRSYAIEEGFTDLVQYRVFNGMVVDSLKLSFGTDGLVDGMFGFIGTNTSAFSGTSIDTTPAAVVAKDKFFHAGGTFQVAGSNAGWLSSLEIELKNGYESFYALGSSGAADIPFGNAVITGKASGMFDMITEYNRFLAGTSTSISASVVAGAESLTFLLPQIKYTKGTIVGNGPAGVMVEFEFEAEYQVAAATALQITRV